MSGHAEIVQRLLDNGVEAFLLFFRIQNRWHDLDFNTPSLTNQAVRATWPGLSCESCWHPPALIPDNGGTTLTRTGI